MKYATPQALHAALTSAARRHAREHGLAPGDLVDRFYFQRLLARVFHRDPGGWPGVWVPTTPAWTLRT